MEELENALTSVFNSFTHLTPEQKRYVVLTFWLNTENSYRAYKEYKNKIKEDKQDEQMPSAHLVD